MSASPQFIFSTDQPLVRDSCISLQSPFLLDCGDQLEGARIAYRVIGDTNLPAVLVLGGISASRKVWCDTGEEESGWWQQQVGPGGSIDTSRYCVVGLDYLGGNGATESPRLWGSQASHFPAITTADQARLICRLLQALGISRLESVIGSSYGGMVALQLAALAPAGLRHCLVIGAADEPSPQATAWRHVQRQVLELGLAAGQTTTALKIARSLAICGYRSEREFACRFKAGAESGPDSVTDYLDYCSTRFAVDFNIHSYRCLSASIDDHRFSPHQAKVPVDLLGFSSDQLVPVHQLVRLRKELPAGGKLILKPSIYGHDAFLKEKNIVARVITDHLEHPQ